MTAPDSLPTAEVIAERRYGGVPAIRVMCPFCSRTHLHCDPGDASAVLAAPCGGNYTAGKETR
jgi:hypothetical protein